MTTNKQRVTLFIKPAIVKHARAQALVEGITLTSLMERALVDFLPKEIIIKKPRIDTDLDP